MSVASLSLCGFNPRPPRGRRLCSGCSLITPEQFQSTPPAREATVGVLRQDPEKDVSIHAPREGGDMHGNPFTRPSLCFNPRPPRGRRLTHGGTGRGLLSFNPRPPRGRRLAARANPPMPENVSIHAPREGGDHNLHSQKPRQALVSIHAPREGGDFQRHPAE